jgi:hypothetical protein
MDKLVIPRNDIAIRNSYTVEVPLENFTRGSKNMFLLNQFLQTNGTSSVIYTGLDVFFATQQSRTETNRPVISSANAAKIAINLKRNGKDQIYLAPYVSYNSNINYGMIRRFKPQGFDLTDSYIQVMEDLPDGTTSALLTFYFDPTK